MTFLDFIFGRVKPAPAPAAATRCVVPSAQWRPANDATFSNVARQVETVGDFAVMAYPDGTAAVRFDTDCQCVVTIGCMNRDVAVYLAGVIDRVMTHSSVDVGLDRI